MEPPALLRGCLRKGIGILGTGDALHPEWRRLWEPHLENDAGIIVVPTGEVEDAARVHHLFLFEDFTACEELGERLKGAATSLSTNGRPHISLTGEKIAREVHDLGGLLGPAHAFTPWTSLYKSYDRVGDCYGDEKIDFLELGLSADSSYGAGIPDLYGVPFLSNSDAHSPDSSKIGREFNQVEISAPSVKAVMECIRKGNVVMNAGFFPEEGKYNRTACSRCFTQYSLEEFIRFKGKCPKDGGRIKKGVADRARELSTGAVRERPPYRHIIPFSEIIRTIEGTSSAGTKRCRTVYENLLDRFGTEIAVLLTVPVGEIAEISPLIGKAIANLRDGRVVLHPGGGGKYGTFDLVLSP
ncbi:MAG: endonuclease Q family protein [Methanoregulaceae archaeon]